MKRKLFSILNSIFLIALIGIGTQSCSDDDDNNNNTETPVPGLKKIDLNIVDENGNPARAEVTIWKNNNLLETVTADRTYSLDVTNEPTNTEYEFMASRDGYISSPKEAVTLAYNSDCHHWNAALTLVISEQADAYMIDQSQNETIFLSSNMDPSRNINMHIPANLTDLEYLELIPTFLTTASSRGLLKRDASNDSPAMESLSLESNWDKAFNDGKRVSFVFPLTQSYINSAKQHNLNLVFGTTDNSTNTWESHPLIIDDGNNTGTVSIPHFSTWHLTVENDVTFDVSNSPVVTLGTSACSQPITVNFNQPNEAVDQTYLDVLGLNHLSAITQSYTSVAVPNSQVTVQAYCRRIQASIEGTDVSFVYYQPPVVFTTTINPCSHIGGGGQ